MLFDLEQDPFEMENVAEHPDDLETKKELQKKLSDFILFDSLGKVYRDRTASQLRCQTELNAQAEQLKQFIQSQWK